MYKIYLWLIFNLYKVFKNNELLHYNKSRPLKSEGRLLLCAKGLLFQDNLLPHKTLSIVKSKKAQSQL